MDASDGPPEPGITEVLARFLEHSCRGRTPASVDRCLRIDAHLRLYLETAGPEHLDAPQACWLALERQLRPAGAFCRVLGADALLAALPGFLSAGWQLPHGVDRRVQASQSSRLVHWLVSRQLVDFRRQRQDLRRFRAALEGWRRA